MLYRTVQWMDQTTGDIIFEDSMEVHDFAEKFGHESPKVATLHPVAAECCRTCDVQIFWEGLRGFDKEVLATAKVEVKL